MKKFLLPSLLILGALLDGCKPVRSTSSVKIAGGRKASDDVKKSTVGLVSLKDDGSKDQLFCTGVVIASDAILTSTQCLESVAAAGVKWGVYLELAPAKIAAVKNSQNASATGARDYPSLNLSVIRLAEPLDNSLYPPAEILRSPAGLKPSTPLLIAGYGRKNSKCLDATNCNVLLEADTSLDSFQDANHLYSTMLVMAKQDQALCFGDAGGPAFVNISGEIYLAGIASGSLRRGGTNEWAAARNDSFACENSLAAFSFVGDYLSWLSTGVGLSLPEVRSGNLPRSTVPALDSSLVTSKPVNAQNWVEWLAFNQYQDPAFGTVSYLQQRLMAAESLRADAATRLSDVDFYLNPVEATKRVQALTELQLKIDAKSVSNLRPVSTIEPLAAFTGLTKLDIEGQAITDFSPLANLTNLTSLRIVGNGTMPKLDAISGLTRLQTLELSDVGVETFRGFDASRLTALKTLTITGKGEAIFIPRAPALETLIIDNADLSDPSNTGLLANLPTTLTSLTIKGSKVTRAEFVGTLANLKTLNLTGNMIRDFLRVNDLKKLTNVQAAGNPSSNKYCGTPAAAVCEYSQVTNPQNLDEYCINYVFQDSGKVYTAVIQSLAQAIGLAAPKTAAECADLYSKLRLKRNLDLVGAGGTGAVDLSPLGTMTALNKLSIKNFGLIDVTPLGRLMNVDILDLSQNLIVDPKPLETMAELIELNLSKNMIASMNNFSHPRLVRLILDGNKLTGVSTLGALPELGSLSLANMPGFKDVKGLGKMGKIKKLNVSKTDVTDLQALEPTVGLEIDAPEEAVKNGCPVLLGSCITGETGVTTAKSGPVPGLKPGKRVQGNPAATVDVPGLLGSFKLQ